MDRKTDPILQESSYYTWGRRDQLIFATFLQSLCCFFALAIYAYVHNMPPLITLLQAARTDYLATNLMGSIGGRIAHYLVNDLCGISAFLIPCFPFAISMKLFLPQSRYSLVKTLALLLFTILWSSLAMGYWHHAYDHPTTPWYLLPGHLTMHIATSLGNLLGGGVLLLLTTSLVSVLIALVTSLTPIPQWNFMKKPIVEREKQSHPDQDANPDKETSLPLLPEDAPTGTSHEPTSQQLPRQQEQTPIQDPLTIHKDDVTPSFSKDRTPTQTT